MSEHSDHRHIVFEGGPEFKKSGARVTITDGLITEEAIMNPATYEAERYWLAGCLRVEDGQYEFRQPPTSGIYFQYFPAIQVPDYCLTIYGIAGIKGDTITAPELIIN